MEKCKKHANSIVQEYPVLTNTPSVSSEESIEEDTFESNPTTYVSQSRNTLLRCKLPQFPNLSLKKTCSQPVSNSDSISILSRAYSETNSYGSSTACIWTLNKSNMNVANLGDSGFLVLRYDAILQKCYIVEESKEQQHNFNTPYQLANIPFDKLKRIPIDQFWNDKPTQSDTYNLTVKAGDIVILATDGLLDNLFTSEILEETEKFLKQNQWISPTKSMNSSKKSRKFNDILARFKIHEPSSWIDQLNNEDACNLAKYLAQRAYVKTVLDDWKSPFGEKVNSLLKQKARNCKNSESNHIHKWRSGKKDDIGVVVAFIS